MPNHLLSNRSDSLHAVRIIIILLFFCTLFAMPSAQAFDCSTVTEIPPAECEALVTIYNSTNGDDWANKGDWLLTNTPCDWSGVECQNGHVTELNFVVNNLKGDIPPEIGDLTHLTILDLAYNQVGSLPTEIGNLTQLTVLYLTYSQNISLPAEIANLTSLTEMDLSNCELSTLPPEICNLSNLTYLYLDNNNLGELPSEIGNLAKLTELDLSNNALTELPLAIVNLTKLTDLNVSDNLLSSLPPELFNLTNLTELRLRNNDLTELPHEIVNLTNLKILDLSENPLLSGRLPADLIKLDQLNEFYFNNTDLCEPLNKAFQDWLSGLTTLQRSGIDCYYLILTYNNDNDKGNIPTFLDDNDVLYSPLYDKTRGDDDLKNELGISRSYLLETAPTASRDLLEQLRMSTKVEDCVENKDLRLDFGSNASLTPLEDMINLKGWEIDRASNLVLTTVIDDFRSLASESEIPSSHGELVAEIADTESTNMLLLNVVRKYDNLAPFEAVLQAIEYAVDEKIDNPYSAAVINLSLSAPITDIGDNADEQQRIATLFQRWLQYAERSDVSVITSVGNFNWNVPHYPAALPETIAVGGTDSQSWRWKDYSKYPYIQGSNFGPHLHLMAQADEPNTDKIGTSFACARVTQVAASVLGVLASPNHPPFFDTFDKELRWLFRTTAIDGVGAGYEDTQGWDPYYGWGVMDEEAAMACAQKEQIYIPSSVDFKPIQIGKTATAAVRIINCYRNTAFTLTHNIPDTSDFVADDPAVEYFLPPGQTRWVEITFNPQTIGDLTAELEITPKLSEDNDNTNPPEALAIDLTGTAECAGPAGVFVVPAVHDFGMVMCGESHSMPFTLMNCTQDEVTIEKVQFSNPTSDMEFDVIGLTDFPIKGRTSGTFEIRFHPQTPLSKHAILEIITDSEPPIEIGVYGSGKEDAAPIVESWSGNPQDADTLMDQANEHYKAEAFWEALELYQQASKIYLSAEHSRGQAQALNGMGLSYAGAGRLQKALQALSESLAVWNDSSDSIEQGIVLNQIALINSRLGNYLTAINAFNQLLEIERNLQRPHDLGRTLLNIGAAYLNQNDFQQARIYFEDALTAAQNVNDTEGQAKAWMNMGHIYRHDERHAQALQAYGQALALINQLEDSAVLQGTLLLQSGDVYLMRNEYADALRFFNDSLAVFQQADNSDGVIAALQKIAELNQLQGDAQEALNSLKQALTFCSAADMDTETAILRRMLEVYMHNGDTVFQAMILNDLAEIHVQNDDLEKALERLQRAQGLNQSNGDIAETRRTDMLYGEVYLRRGNRTLAIDYLRQALNSGVDGVEYGDEARILTDLGEAYLQDKNYHEAWEQLQAALTIQPENGRAWLYLGELYLLSGKDDNKARDAFEQALQHLGETDYANLARANDGLARVYSRYGEPSEAIDALKDALLNYRLAGDFENEALALTAIGNMYTNLGDQSEAMNAYEQALECYRESGDIASQLAVLQRIIELRNSDDPSKEAGIQLELAQAYTDAGKYDNAKNALNEAMEIYKDLGDPIGQAKTRLQTGIIHRILQEYLAASNDFNRALSLIDDNANALNETDAAILRGKIRSNLGQTLFYQSLFNEALSQYQLALEQYQSAGDLEGQGQTLMKMGEAYLGLGEYVTSVQYYDQALKILKQTDEHIYQVMAYLQNAATDGVRGLYWDAVEAYLRALGIIHEAGMFMYAEELHRYKTDILDTPVVTPTPTPTPTLIPTPNPSPTPASQSSGPTITNASLNDPAFDTTSINTQLASTTPVPVSTSAIPAPISANPDPVATTSDAHSEEAAPTPAPTTINNPPPADISNPVDTTRDASSSTNAASNNSHTGSIEAPVDESREPIDNAQTSEEQLNFVNPRSDADVNAQPGTPTPAIGDSPAMPTLSKVTSFPAPNSIPSAPQTPNQAPTEAVFGWALECQGASEDLPSTDDPRILKNRADTLQRCAEHYLRIADYINSLEMTLLEIDIRQRLEDHEGAIQALIRKLVLFQKTGRSKIEQADVMRAIADLLILQGRDNEALTYLNDILTIFREKGLFTQAAQTQNSIGLIWLRQGDFLQAERAFLDAQALLKAHPDSAVMAMTNGNLGTLRYLLGQYDDALDFFQKALAIIDLLESERVFNVLVLFSKTAYHFRLGHLAPARQNFEYVLAEYKKTQYLSIKATLLNHLALVHYKQMRGTDQEYAARQERYGEGMALFQKARTMMRVLREPASAWTIANNMGLLNCRMGRIAEQGGHGQKAAGYYNEALVTFQEVYAQAIGGEAGRSATLHNLGRVYAALGQYDEALTNFEKALKNEQAADKARTLGEIGFVYERKGNLNRAVDYYVRSVDVQERIRRQARIDAFKISLAEQSVDVFQRAIPLLIGMGRIEKAFNLSEQARARALLEQLGDRPEPMLANAPAKLMAEKLALENKLRRLRQKLQKAHVNNAKTKNRKTQSNHAIALLEKQIEVQLKIYDQTAHALGTYAAESRAFTQVKPLTMAQVRQHLNDDVSLVSYFVTPEKIIAFILTRNASHAVEIPVRESELTQTINWTPQASAAYPTLPALKKLYTWLVEPVQPYLKTASVRVVPHGILHSAPFHALTADGSVYWGDRHRLTRLPSASILPFLRQKNPLPGTHRVLAFGNPDGARHGLPDLECVKDETGSFAKNFGATPYIGKTATESRLVAKAEDADIIFISSHARLDAAHPLHSHLILAPDASSDGLLEVHEIYRLYLKNAPLVVLSACNTYLGKHSRGDEIVGLTRAFFHAGAPSVVSSLWKVNDDATSYFMQKFGGFLAQGMSQADALKKARIITRQRYRKALYWAAFVLTGDAGDGEKMVAAR